MAKIGRPTKYKPEYCQQIIEFFDRPPTKTKIITWTTKSGTVKTEEVEVPNTLPTLERFAFSIGVSRDAMLKWCKAYPEFNKAFICAKDLYADFLKQNGVVKGRYDSGFASLVAINTTDMRAKETVEISQSGPWTIEVVKFGQGKPEKK